MKFKKRYILPLIFLGVLFFGPQPEFKQVDGEIVALEIPLDQLDQYIQEKENRIEGIKPDNESRIVWADSVRKTEYAVVYLHGFSAGIWEGDGVHTHFAKRYGANLYLARLQDHGIDGQEVFMGLTPENYLASAKEAISIGRLLGEKLILMSCSTGGTHSIYLTANNPELVHAQILYSPNIAVANPAIQLTTKPWGAHIASALIGDYVKTSSHGKPDLEKINTTIYRTEGIIALESLLEQTMTPETFRKIKAPFFMGYYYKNEEEQDPVVSVPAMLEMAAQIQTPESMKRLAPFAEVGNHVVCSAIKSKDIETVRQETYLFAEEILGMEPR